MLLSSNWMRLTVILFGTRPLGSYGSVSTSTTSSVTSFQCFELCAQLGGDFA
jgi:hypothetical protein